MLEKPLTTPAFAWLSATGASAIALLYLNTPAAALIGVKPTLAPAVQWLINDGQKLDQVMVAPLADGFLVTCHGGAAVREAISSALLQSGAIACEPPALWHAPTRLAREVAALLPRVRGRWGLSVALRTIAQPPDLGAPVAALRQSRWLLEPPRVQFWGPVNAGKSSLLNALCGEQLAAVADEPGLTRDLIEGQFEHEGVVVRVFDAPGEGGHGAIDAAALALARQWRDRADLVINLVPPGKPLLPDADREWHLHSRCDESGLPGVSANLPETLDALKARIIEHFVGGLRALPDPWLAPLALLDALQAGGDLRAWLGGA